MDDLVERARERIGQPGRFGYSPDLQLIADLATALQSAAEREKGLRELAVRLDQMATDHQEWADHPEIGGKKPRFSDHLKGKRYGYSHAAQLVRAALTTQEAGG